MCGYKQKSGEQVQLHSVFTNALRRHADINANEIEVSFAGEGRRARERLKARVAYARAFSVKEYVYVRIRTRRLTFEIVFVYGREARRPRALPAPPPRTQRPERRIYIVDRSRPRATFKNGNIPSRVLVVRSSEKLAHLQTCDWTRSQATKNV